MKKRAATLGAGTYGLLTTGFVAFVVYGSLVPLHFEPLTSAEVAARARAVCAQPIRVESLSDWFTNVVLFVPLGFLLMGAVCVDRPRRLVAAAFLVLIFAPLLSAGVEFSQLFFPPRVASLNDVTAESSGAVLGIALWLAGGQGWTRWVRRRWDLLIGGGWAVRVLFVYFVILLVTHTLPLDLTLHPVELYHKYRDERIHLLPFALGELTPLQLLAKEGWNFLYFLPFGLLLPHLHGPEWRLWESWRRVLVVGLIVAGGIEFAQLFVLSRNTESTDVITGTLAILGGWSLSLGWLRFCPSRETGDASTASGRSHEYSC